MKYKLVLLLCVCGWPLEKTHAAINRTFPVNFKFGAASASYQVEGGWNVDGKSENIWDHICHEKPTYVANQDNGDIACDSYHKYKEDVAMLKDLGVDFYRFSISWSRVIPGGVAGSPVNQLGLDYYRNLVQELVDNGIEPMVTMFHWDLPEALQELGGWPNPELEDHFVYYARTLYKELGDLVKHWMTFNEPKQTCLGGYGDGDKAPGYTSSGVADYQCTHILLKTHAKAYHIYDEEFRAEQQGSVGIVIDTAWFEPASGSDEDKEAAERGLQFTFGWFANPVINGNYPQVMIDRIDERSAGQGFEISRLPKFTDEEIEYIKGTHDFVALNFYTATYAQWLEEADINDLGYYSDLNILQFPDDAWEETVTSWFRVVPWGIRKAVNWISKTYDNPEIFITENGYPDAGGLEDDRRINYHKEYLSNLLEAILDDGVNVTRYTVWSLMDNFEWTSGYNDKLGLYSVDFEDPDRPRTPKASAAYYKQVIATRCLVDVCE
ncbi:myrosinase 1-like [Tenebrio molitor]|uniref:myrosinase 1-like n=1 Tax=Tenebrio molitor TaxID=7067 RepID=UPI0036249275